MPRLVATVATAAPRCGRATLTSAALTTDAARHGSTRRNERARRLRHGVRRDALAAAAGRGRGARRGRRPRAAAGHPARDQGHHRHPRRADDRQQPRPRPGVGRGRRRAGRRAAARARRRDHRQDHHERVRHRRAGRRQGVPDAAQPVERRAHARPAPAPAPAWRSPRGSRSAASAPTPAARCAARRRPTASPASRRPSAGCRRTGASRSPTPSTRSVRWPAARSTARCCWRRSRDTIPAIPTPSTCPCPTTRTWSPGGDVDGLRVGVPTSYFFDGPSSTTRCATAVLAAVDVLAGAGARVARSRCPTAPRRRRPTNVIGGAEALAHHRADLTQLGGSTTAATPAPTSRAVRCSRPADYVQAQRFRTWFRSRLRSCSPRSTCW